MFQTFLHQTNYLAIVVSAIVYFAIGAVWYSSILFAKPWMQNVGRTEEQLRGGNKIVFLYSFLAELVIVFVLAFLVWILGTPDCISAIKVGLFFSLGFTTTVLAINSWYGQRPAKLLIIDAGYHITGIVFATIILTVWN